jgi:probable phosphoglycerate mutase
VTGQTTNRLYLVRHGQSVANVTREFSYRAVDPPLTELGVEQARITAEHLRPIRVDAIYASPLLRAVQTAEIFRDALGVDFEVIEQLREVDVGELEGRPPTEEAWAIHSGIQQAWAAGRHGATFPGGEDYHALSGRAREAFGQCLAGRSDQTVVIVAHGAIFTAAVDALCPDVSMAEIIRLPNGNCGITIVDVGTEGARLSGTMACWARRTHLDRLPQARFPPPWLAAVREGDPGPGSGTIRG